MSNKPNLMISVAPTDPEEKKNWTEQMTRIQLAMYVDGGATCEYCKHKYENVDDFIAKDVRRGNDVDDKFTFVCGKCWADYEEATA